jgi:transposase-like protein
MDRLAPAVSNPRRRRRYSAEFKAMVIKACDESGQFIAGLLEVESAKN